MDIFLEENMITQEKYNEIKENIKNGTYFLKKFNDNFHLVCRYNESNKTLMYSILSGDWTSDGNNENEDIFIDNNFKDPKPINFVKQIIQSITMFNNGEATEREDAALKNSLNDDPCHTEPLGEVSQIQTQNRDISPTAQYDNEPDIILDFFAGSGTTAHAVMELNRADNGNRECILVTNNEITELNPNGIAVDVTAKRLKRIMSGECYDGSKNFKWREKNEPYKDNLEVFRIEKVSKYAQESNKSVLEVIDESAYGLIKFDSIHEKAKWIAKNFDITLKELENDKAYKMRQKGE